MATIGDTMVTLLTDNWAGAGAAPTFGHLVDHPSDLPPSQEQVMVRLPIHEDVTPINDTYSNFKYTIQIRVKSNVSDDRLKVLADEVIRIVNTYAITGITRQFAKRGENTSDRKKQVFAYDVWAILEEHMSTAGTSYSSPGAGDVTMPADLTVTDNFGFDTGETVDVILDEDDMASDDENALATQQSIKAYADAVAAGAAALIEDDVYGAGWNADTTHAPSQNAVYDKIAAMDVTIAANTTPAEAIAAVVAENPLTLTNNLTVSGGTVSTPSSAAIDALRGGVIRLKLGGVEKIYIGSTLTIFKTDIRGDNDILTQSNKSADVGATGVAWDNMYADDYVNESPFKKFDKPLDKLKKIKDKDGELDYKSLPDWIRATKRINQVVEIDKDGNKTVIEEGEKVVAEKGLSINRMCILLYQALQEATARIEALEAR